MSRKILRLEDSPKAPEPYPHIAAGRYRAEVTSVETGSSYSKESIYVNFVLLDGPHVGTKVFMACNSRGTSISRRMKYYKEWCKARGKSPATGEPLDPDTFKHKTFLVEVRDTIRKDSNGQPLPYSEQYSVVDHIIEVISRMW